MKLSGSSKEIPDITFPLPLSCLGKNLQLNSNQFIRQLQKLPREETLSICSKLNLIFSEATSRRKPHQELVMRLLCHHQWLDISDFSRIKRFCERENQSMEDNPFFTRPACLELIRWCSVWANPSSKGAYNDISRKHGFARSMLMAFEIWSTRSQCQILGNSKHAELDEESQQFDSMRVFREANLWTVPTFSYYLHLGRAHELFIDLFLSKSPGLRAKIEEEMGFSIEDHICCTIGLISLISGWFDSITLSNNFEFVPSRLCEQSPHMEPTMQRYIALEGQSADELARKYSGQAQELDASTDLRPLREKPILLFGKGSRATIIDPTFLAERSSNGLLFRSANVDKDAMKKFGEAFEEYAIRRLDRYCNSLVALGHRVTGRARVKAKTSRSNVVEFADYLMVCGRVLIIVEIKGKWLQDKAVYNASATEYWDEIYSKYVLDVSNRKPKKKGVSQLAESINGFVCGEIELENSMGFGGIEFVIPVLLVYDNHLPILYHGKFLGREFQKALVGRFQGWEQFIELGETQVMNLCLLSMDDFELFENRILRKDLAELLFEYSEKFPAREISAGAFLSRLDKEPLAPDPGIVTESKRLCCK